MNLYQFLIPTHDNAGNSHEKPRAAFEKAMLEVAGGFTELPQCRGQWKDDHGKVHKDDVIPYNVAIPTSREGTLASERIEGLVREAFKLFSDQHAIYCACIGEANIHDRPAGAA